MIPQKRPRSFDRDEEKFYEGLAGNIENERQHDAYGEKDKEEPVLFSMDRRSLHGKHESPGKPRKYIDKDEIDYPHVS